MKDDLSLLEMMMADQQHQSEVHRPGPYWRHYQKRVHTALKRYGLARFRDTPAVGKGFVDIITTDPLDLEHNPASFKAKLLRKISRMSKVRKIVRGYQDLVTAQTNRFLRMQNLYYETCFGDLLRREFEQFTMPDTLHGETRNTITLDGQQYAANYLKFLLEIITFQPMARFDSVRSFMEIGGGFGALTHLTLARHQNIRKVVYLDIPPMIYIGTQYLRHFFPEAVRDYRETRDLEKIRFSDNDDLEILCVCPWQAEQLDLELDFLVNFSSFSEMTPEIVNNYGRIFQNLASDQASVCLRMNKGGEDKTTAPDQVMAAFEPMFSFQPVTPVGEPLPVQYQFGKKNG